MTSEALPTAAETVLTFLESVGRRSEAELYLKLFRELPPQSFALVSADAPVVSRAVGGMLEQLRFLADLGLVAPIVVGAISSERAERLANELAEWLPAVSLIPRLHSIDDADLTARLTEELRSDEIPIVWFRPRAGEPPRARFSRLGGIARNLGSRKVVILRERGSVRVRDERGVHPFSDPGALRENGQISVLNLRTDLEPLRAANQLGQPDAKLLDLIAALLEEAREGTTRTVSVTSPFTLLRELFTVKGSGTLVKAGSEILRYQTYRNVEVPRLQNLLERSFGRRLVPDFFERETLAIYVESSYQGAAIVEPSPVGPYLTKFAVEPVAQGEGLGHDLWQALTREHRTIVWRAAPYNPIGSWYVKQCDGMMRFARWHVYWRGLELDAVAAAIAEAIGRPTDLEPPTTPDPTQRE
ncbi:MAG: hypothetical protein JW751_03630 [Polyangiaceae bacterium]|nr:hypothetical protein [Polyangiaceae bacterium]